MLGNGTIGRLRQINDRGLMDRCVILEHAAGSTNGYGLANVTYTAGSGVNCLFRPEKRGEGMDQSDVPLADARMRLEMGTEIRAVDRVRLTHLHGDALAQPEDYEIIGEPRRTYTGIVLRLKLVTTG